MNILDRLIPRPLYEGEGGGAGAGDGDKGAGDKGAGASGMKAGAEADAAAAAAAAAAAGQGDKGGGDDWRSSFYEEGDEDAARFLQRFKDPKAFTKSALEAQKTLRSGGRDIPAPDAEKDPEGLKQWRADRGLPETPDAYEVDKKVQERFTDDDKPLVSAFLEHAHKSNLDAHAVNSALDYYLTIQDQADAELKEADTKHAESFEEEMRKELGSEYKPVMTAALKFAESETPGINWAEARMPDGRRLGSIPEFARAMIAMSNLKYGDASYSSMETAKASESRLTELQALKKEKGIDWWDAPAQKALRDEELELTVKAQKHAERAGQ